jgi:hypothetical protein
MSPEMHWPWNGRIENLGALQALAPVFFGAILLWFANMALTGWLARRRGRDDGLWAVLAFFLGPVALLTLLIVPHSRLRRSAPDPTTAVPASAPQWPTHADGWVRLEYPPPPITIEQRLFGALVGGALGGTGAGVLLMLGGQPLAWVEVILWAAAGGAAGYVLSGELIGATAAKLVGVGLAAAALAIVMAEVMVGVMGAIPDLSMGAVGVFSIMLAVGGSIVSPVLYAVYVTGPFAASLAGGIMWAAATHLVLRRGSAQPVQSAGATG